jgi:UrcA family protein
MAMIRPRQTTRLGFLAGAFLLVSQAALSQGGGQQDKVEVIGTPISVRDVDLSTAQGARWLYRQIVSTAKAVCWNSVERHGGVQWLSTQASAARRCFDDSVNDALARVNSATGLDIELLAGLDRYDEAVAASR